MRFVKALKFLNCVDEAMHSLFVNGRYSLFSKKKFTILYIVIMTFFILIFLGYNTIFVALSSTSSCDDVQSLHTAVMYLSKPQHRFHGNHWFHIGEYYLAKRNHALRMSENFKHIKILTHEPKLSSMMTKLSFSLIVLACLNSNIESIELFAPIAKKMSGIKYNEPIYFTSYGPLFGYYANRQNPDDRFVEYGHSSLRSFSGSDLVKHIFVGRSDNSIYLDKPLQCYCGSYIGAVGDIATRSDNWFNSTNDIVGIRKSTNSMCSGDSIVENQEGYSINNKTHSVHHKNKNVNTIEEKVTSEPTENMINYYYNIVIYQRDQTRLFSNFTNMLEAINEYIYNSAPSTAHYSKTNRNNNDDIGTKRNKKDVYNSNVMHNCIYNNGKDPSTTEITTNNINCTTATTTTTSPSEYHDSNKRGWRLRVIKHNEYSSPCALYHILHTADIFLTAHGFQATALMFMKKGAVIIEVFPYKYYKESYMTLSRQFGIHHRWIQNAELPSTTTAAAMSTSSINTINNTAMLDTIMYRSRSKLHRTNNHTKKIPMYGIENTVNNVSRNNENISNIAYEAVSEWHTVNTTTAGSNDDNYIQQHHTTLIHSSSNAAASTKSLSMLFSFLYNSNSGSSASYLLQWISQEDCMNDLTCRSYARSRDISMPPSHIQLVFKTMQEVQEGLLGVHNAPIFMF